MGYKLKTTTKYFLMVALLSLISVWIGTIIFIDYRAYQAPFQHLQAYTFTTSSDFDLTWTERDVILGPTIAKSGLFELNDSLYLYGANRQNNWYLEQRTKTNGQVIEQTSLNRLPIPTSFSRLQFITYDYPDLYLGYNGAKAIPDSTLSAGGTAAYSVQQQRIRWSKRVPGVNRLVAFFARNGTISVSNGGDYYVLDVAERTISEKISSATPHLVGQTKYSSVDETSLWYAYSDLAVTHNYRVQNANLLKDSEQIVILENGTIIVAQKSMRNTSYIDAINPQTGQVSLSLEIALISNIDHEGDYIYYLSLPNQLHRTNMNNGRTEILGEFSTDSFMETDRRTYYVLASENQLFLYLGDSQQLMALDR